MGRIFIVHTQALFFNARKEAINQLRRIRARNGEEGAQRFVERWIPLEERYFTELDVRAHCGLCYLSE